MAVGDYNKRCDVHFSGCRIIFSSRFQRWIVHVRLPVYLCLLLLITAALFQPTVIAAQVVGRPSPNQIPQNPTPDETRERMQHEMAKKVNEERQAQLKRDADHLFKLATELKAFVDKSSENTLSLDVVKKAEEIEKLAHSVKEKMKGN